MGLGLWIGMILGGIGALLVVADFIHDIYVAGAIRWQVLLQNFLLLVMIFGFLGAWKTGMGWREDFDNAGCEAFCTAKVAHACGMNDGKQLTLENGIWMYKESNSSFSNGNYTNWSTIYDK